MKTIVAEPETYRLSIADPSVMLPVYMPSKEHPCPEGHKPPAVRITQKHINAGAGADRFSCVVAEGAKDGAIPDIERSVAYFEYRTHIDKFFPSPKTRRAIIRFDILAAQGLGGLGFGEPGLYEFLPVPFCRTPSGRKQLEHDTVKPQGPTPQRGSRDPGGVIARRALTERGVRDGALPV